MSMPQLLLQLTSPRLTFLLQRGGGNRGGGDRRPDRRAPPPARAPRRDEGPRDGVRKVRISIGAIQQPSSPWLRLTFAGAAPSFSSVITRSSLACDITQLRRITPCFWSLAIWTSGGGLEQTNTKLTPTSGLTEQTR
jgi:hypothetical protein